MISSDILARMVHVPHAFQGELRDGYALKIHNRCRRCKQLDCIKRSSEGVGHLVCSAGFSCYPLSFDDGRFILIGLIDVEFNHAIKGDRRKGYRQYRYSLDEARALQERINGVLEALQAATNVKVKDSVSYLHDIRTSVGIVLSCCQSIIDTSKGGTFEEKLSRVDRDVFNLFQSINLLQEQLDLADIIANPSSITYGHKRRSKLHGFLYRLVRIFEPRAFDRGLLIELRGRANGEIETFNSFQFVPLVLLDNAVKYSASHKDIYVDVSETREEITAKFSSFGRIIPEEWRERVFEKYERGPNATKGTSRGMGLGLYLARQICLAHGTNVTYNCVTKDGVVGTNEFAFTLPIVESTIY